MMKIAIPQWQDRVSPVFDVAGNLLVVDVANGLEEARLKVDLTATDPLRRAQQVAGLAPDVLICGAISWPLEMALTSAGVRVISQICGGIDEVLEAFANGNLADERFIMPGCCRRRRMRGRRHRHGGGFGGLREVR
ncbi:MAG: NifB/NifX family molybdenum-iron cluster-binding protein [Phycisphaerae bacterium]